MATNSSSSIITTRVEVPTNAIPGDAGFTIEQPAVVTNTTTVDKPLGEVVTNVSYTPYMRGLEIEFAAYRLRPYRKFWYYFDDTMVSQFVERPNIIETTTRSTQIKDIIKGNRERIQIGSSVAKVLCVETNETDGNTRIYATHFENPASVAVGTIITSLDSTYTGVVKNFKHYSGQVRSGSSVNNVKLSLDSDNSADDFYKGNVITIV